MEIIAGCLIVKDNKILMVKEGKKICYGKWSLPAGHLEANELIPEAAIREAYEETGYKVKLTGLLPISTIILNDSKTLILVQFTAEIIEENENAKFNEKEILDVKWIDIEEVKNMREEELRGYDIIMQTIKKFENKEIYPLEIFNNTKYGR